jgi:hypothetical protein
MELKAATPVGKPIVKMKQVRIFVSELPDKLVVTNESGRLVAEISKPPPAYSGLVDVALGPDAKLDELANLIAELWGNVIFLSHTLKTR